MRAMQRTGLLAVLAACASQPVPDPKLAARAWADAVRSGDAAALHALLTDSGRANLGRSGVAERLSKHRAELERVAAAALAPSAHVLVTAEVPYPHDRRARVVVEEGRFRVAAAGALPAAAATPVEALRELRDVLVRRSYSGLLRVLTRDTGQTLDGSINDLAKALDEPSTVEIDVDGRRATARLPGGHVVQLEREDGVWRVKDFD